MFPDRPCIKIGVLFLCFHLNCSEKFLFCFVLLSFLLLIESFYECYGSTQWLSDKESNCNAGDEGYTSSIPGLGRSLRGGHAIHSSILAWRIPWTEETGGLQSIRSQRVGNIWSDLAWMHEGYVLWVLIIIWFLECLEGGKEQK